MDSTASSGEPFDLLLLGGHIVDGSGAPRFAGDLGIVGDEIAAVGDLRERTSRRTLDVTGKIVAPGFVDALHNADMAVLLSPDVDMAISQGVTTALAGCCGVSMAPVASAYRDDVRTHAFFKTGYHDREWDWLTVADYLERVDGASAINLATLVGFDNIWFAVRGFDASAPTAKEIDAMRGLASECMDQGAIGMSHGAGAASLWSTHEQVVAVAQGMGSRGVYACHQRTLHLEDPFAWVREGVAVGLKADIPTHFLHFKSTSERTHGREAEMVEVVDELGEKGARVTLGSYPYASGGGGVRVPDWAEEGGPSETLARLRDPETRRRLIREIEEMWTWDPHFTAIRNPDNTWMEGRHLAELAQEADTSRGELICRLVESDYGSQHVHDHGGGPGGLEAVMRHENHIACSDAIYAGKHPHPRCFGAYPRYLGLHVRERQVLSLEECIRQMTSSPARMMGLDDRGELRAGKKADVVVFDEQTVDDRSTLESPRALPVGIDLVVVNGTVVREDDSFTGATPGRALTRAA